MNQSNNPVSLEHCTPFTSNVVLIRDTATINSELIESKNHLTIRLTHLLFSRMNVLAPLNDHIQSSFVMTRMR